MCRQRVYLMGRQAIIPKLEGRAATPRSVREIPDGRADVDEREREFRFRAHALPSKGNLMGQLNRYYRVESTSGSLTFDPLLSDVNLIILPRAAPVRISRPLKHSEERDQHLAVSRASRLMICAFPCCTSVVLRAREGTGRWSHRRSARPVSDLNARQ